MHYVGQLDDLVVPGRVDVSRYESVEKSSLRTESLYLRLHEKFKGLAESPGDIHMVLEVEAAQQARHNEFGLIIVRVLLQ